jgi:hypothetical protein
LIWRAFVGGAGARKRRTSMGPATPIDATVLTTTRATRISGSTRPTSRVRLRTLIEYGYIGNVFLQGNKDVGMLILGEPNPLRRPRRLVTIRR